MKIPAMYKPKDMISFVFWICVFLAVMGVGGIPAIILYILTCRKARKTMWEAYDSLLPHILVSVGFLIFIIVFIVVFFVETDDALGTFILFGMWAPLMVIAVAFVVQRSRLKKNVLLNTRVYSLVYESHITGISQISEILGVSDEQVVNSVRYLIGNGKLRGANVDEQKNSVEFTHSVWAKQRVVCEHCGAKIVVNFGATLVCEYCGGVLRVRTADNRVVTVSGKTKK